MDKFYHSVRLDEELCKGCINCLKRCPTQAIRVQDGKAGSTKNSALTAASVSGYAPITQNMQSMIGLRRWNVSDIRWPFRPLLYIASLTIWMY